MATTAVGKAAETTVANFLSAEGYKILGRNWRTKVCEIDIVAQKDQTIYFIEVKFRSAQAQGSGFEYIGPQKLRRLRFAAAIWCQNYSWEGDYQLLAAAVDGQTGEIEISEID